MMIISVIKPCILSIICAQRLNVYYLNDVKSSRICFNPDNLWKHPVILFLTTFSLSWFISKTNFLIFFYTRQLDKNTFLMYTRRRKQPTIFLYL